MWEAGIWFDWKRFSKNRNDGVSLKTRPSNAKKQPLPTTHACAYLACDKVQTLPGESNNVGRPSLIHINQDGQIIVRLSEQKQKLTWLPYLVDTQTYDESTLFLIGFLSHTAFSNEFFNEAWVIGPSTG